MTTSNLQARLNPLFESLKQTQQLIARLSKLPSQPGSSPSNPDEGDARVELSSEIHQSLKEQEEDFELIRQEAEDLTNNSSWSRRRDSGRDTNKQRERTDLASQIARFGEDLKIARAQFRTAQLQAKRNAEAAKRKERELLFASIQEGASQTTNYGRRKGQEKQTQEELLLGASNDVTAALRRTHNLMSSELERSQFARETLENSTRELATLTETYSNLDTLLSSSKTLVSTLIYSQKSDTWYLETAFCVLSITIGWLVFRRLIYGPGWWLLYFPLRTLWWSAASIVSLLFGSLSAVSGAFGAKNQSIALSQASESLSTSIAQSLGTGRRLGIPTIPPNMPAPSVKVGGGGHGAKAEDPRQQAGRSREEKSMSDQVGEMAEKSKEVGNPEGGSEPAQQQDKGTVLRDRIAKDGPPNPKKRMWEEPLGSDQGNRPRDEL